ncbi:MAG: Ig-like domain-containing protein, partial [Myxococcota bacterium]|nr:Ig-like domain-containing protein [Myxococcota bacterium]
MRCISFLTVPFFLSCASDDGLKTYNSDPTATITSHADGDEVLEGMAVTFRGSMSDPNHQTSELTSTWRAGDRVLCAEVVADADGNSVCDAVLEENDVEVQLEVRDPQDAVGIDTVAITVIPTESPEAAILTPEVDGVYYTDQLITFSGVVSDAEDDTEDLTVYWKSSLNDDLSNVTAMPNADGEVIGYGNLSEGQHAIELHVRDSSGKTGLANVIVEVGPPNTAPECSITAPENGGASPEGDTVTFVGLVSDVDVPASYLTVEWSSDKDGALGDSSPDSAGVVTFPTADLSTNTHVVSMKVLDEVGAECVANLTYSIGSPPTITIDAPIDGETYSEGESVSFSATVSDAQDNADEIALEWDLNGAVFSTQGATSSGVAQFIDSSLAYGEYVLTVTATDSDGLTASDVIAFGINGVPSQPTLELTPDPAYTDDSLSVSATNSVDPEGSPVNYTYEWFQDGTLTTHTGSSVPASDTSKGETWKVRVTPNDGTADGAFAEAETSIQNTAPTLSSLSIAPSSGISNSDTLLCSVTVTDPDETLTPSYEWSIGGNVVGSGSSLDLAAIGANPQDEVTCSVSVTDDEGESASDSTAVTIDNSDPTVDSIAIDTSPIYTNSLVECTATVGDADGESVSPVYEWSVGTTVVGSGTPLQLDSSLVQPGDTLLCTATVEDGFGGSASDTASAPVENTDPTIDTMNLTPVAPTASDILTCVASTSDTDGDVPTLSFSWTNDTTGDALNPASISAEESTVQLDSGVASPGDEITCSVTAEDAAGGTVSDSMTVAVQNTGPEFTSDALIDPQTGVVVGTELTCAATADDLDDGALAIDYEWSVGSTSLATGDSYTVSASDIGVGDEITCSATASDSDGESIVSSNSVTVENTAPVLSGLSISPSTAYNDETLTCSATVTDPDETLTVDYAWSVGATSLATGASIDLSAHSVNPDDAVICTASVSDSDGGSDSDTIETTIGNRAPVLSGASIDNTSPYANDSITCSVSVSDEDGETLTPTYEWTNGSAVLGSSASLTLTPSDVAVGDTITCTASVEDGYGGSDSTTATATVQNTDPTMSSVSIDLSSPSVADLLTCSATGEDLNDGTLTAVYSWTNDSTSATLGSTATLQLDSTIASPDDVISCSVAFTDSNSATVSDSASVTVINTAPEFDVSASIDPSTGVVTGSELTCLATASDSDDGSVTPTYEWSVGTVVIGSGDTYTVSASDTNVGDAITCTATAIDSDGETTTSTASVTVENTAPVVSGTSISGGTYNDDT